MAAEKRYVVICLPSLQGACEWSRHRKQGVYFFPSPRQSTGGNGDNVPYSFTFEPSSGDIKMEFNGASDSEAPWSEEVPDAEDEKLLVPLSFFYIAIGGAFLVAILCLTYFLWICCCLFWDYQCCNLKQIHRKMQRPTRWKLNCF